MKAKKWVLAKHFDGFPKHSDLVLEEEELGELQDGEVIIQAEYLSVDPYMRPYSMSLPVGSTMIGQQVARVVESRNEGYPVGGLFVAGVGWRSHTKLNLDKLQQPPDTLPLLTRLPDLGELPLSLGVGTLGMPGATAYFGLLRICEPKEGETLLVNAAAGAVGSAVGQIGKIKGLKVIGYAGTDKKCEWLKELGFDYAFNYKTCDLDATLKEAAPDGIDCYFDNVGGDFTATVIANHMKRFGRISVCGAIAGYNAKTGEYPSGPYPWMYFIQKQLRMEGFLVHRWRTEWLQALKELAIWIKEGKLQFQEHVTEGFEKMPDAFFGMLRGENTGKAVVKANP